MARDRSSSSSQGDRSGDLKSSRRRSRSRSRSRDRRRRRDRSNSSRRRSGEVSRSRRHSSRSRSPRRQRRQHSSSSPNRRATKSSPTRRSRKSRTPPKRQRRSRSPSSRINSSPMSRSDSRSAATSSQSTATGMSSVVSMVGSVQRDRDSAQHADGGSSTQTSDQAAPQAGGIHGRLVVMSSETMDSSVWRRRSAGSARERLGSSGYDDRRDDRWGDRRSDAGGRYPDSRRSYSQSSNRQILQSPRPQDVPRTFLVRLLFPVILCTRCSLCSFKVKLSSLIELAFRW